MKKILSLLTVLSSLSTLAAEKVQVLEGTGIDQNLCRIEITRDGDQLKDVKIQGAAEVFEIMAENGGTYGPRRSIRRNAGSEVLLNGSGIFEKFSHSENLFSDGETFTLDTSDLPQHSSQPGLAGLKMLMSISLNYDNGELVSATVSNKAKALLVATLASSKYICNK